MFMMVIKETFLFELDFFGLHSSNLLTPFPRKTSPLSVRVLKEQNESTIKLSHYQLVTLQLKLVHQSQQRNGAVKKWVWGALCLMGSKRASLAGKKHQHPGYPRGKKERERRGRRGTEEHFCLLCQQLLRPSWGWTCSGDGLATILSPPPAARQTAGPEPALGGIQPHLPHRTQGRAMQELRRVTWERPHHLPPWAQELCTSQGPVLNAHTCRSMDLNTRYRSRLVRISPALPNV